MALQLFTKVNFKKVTKIYIFVKYWYCWDYMFPTKILKFNTCLSSQQSAIISCIVNKSNSWQHPEFREIHFIVTMH